MKMTVKEFKDFCCTSNIVLKDSYTGRVYTKIIPVQEVHGEK